MKEVTNDQLAAEEQKREFIRDFIKKRDLIKSSDNVIYVQKLFVVNAILGLCFKKAREKKMSVHLWDKTKKIIAQYIAGVIDIKWTDDDYIVIEED
jgi:hypothetical protein